jgi:ATP-dependent Lon protease
MVTSIISSITGIPVNRNIAMTGEVTLRGHVLPIGGLKEKLLAAHRARIAIVIIPEDNKKDLVEIPKNILDNIEIKVVKTVDEVLKIALTKELIPVEWIEVETLQKSKSGEKPTTGSTH